MKIEKFVRIRTPIGQTYGARARSVHAGNGRIRRGADAVAGDSAGAVAISSAGAVPVGPAEGVSVPGDAVTPAAAGESA